MKDYNDYVAMTKKYLKDYYQLQIAGKNLAEEIEAQTMMLQSESVAISRYGGEPGGGVGELNAVEAAADRRTKMKQQIENMKQDQAEIERVIRKIDRALKGLRDADRDLVQGHFIDGYSWRQLGKKSYCSEKWAREKGNKALKEVVFMLFGIYTETKCMSLAFADERLV